MPKPAELVNANFTMTLVARIRVAGVAAGEAEWLLMQEIAQRAEREASHHSPLPRWRGCGENRSESSEDRSEPLPYSYLGQFLVSCWTARHRDRSTRSPAAFPKDPCFFA
jgi:hypothetical protein